MCALPTAPTGVGTVAVTAMVLSDLADAADCSPRCAQSGVHAVCVGMLFLPPATFYAAVNGFGCSLSLPLGVCFPGSLVSSKCVLAA